MANGKFKQVESKPSVLELIKGATNLEEALGLMAKNTPTVGTKFDGDRKYRAVEPMPRDLPVNKRSEKVTKATASAYGAAVIAGKTGTSLNEVLALVGSPTTTGHAFRELARLGLIEPAK